MVVPLIWLWVVGIANFGESVNEALQVTACMATGTNPGARRASLPATLPKAGVGGTTTEAWAGTHPTGMPAASGQQLMQ